MTIDIKIVSAPDISVANDVINLHRAGENHRSALSAASFLVDYASNTSVAGVLRFIFSLIVKSLPEYNVLLLVGNSAWQSDTRVVRYRKLWGGTLKFRGSEILGGSDPRESIVASHGKLKFFCALRLSELSIGTVVDVIIDERCSYIVATPKSFDIEPILDVGWSGSLAEDFSLCGRICEEKGLLFKQVGEFDDHEWGFVSVGSPEILKKLLS
ncbi:hypothetical protein [Pseudomonas poae]|uniref:hypothetical protein n=1 Tax=Pseudomonas poae TaxID=200451 RepID=UPI001EE2BBC6|nr:hypothetical protein [Pseudomonas poae]